jgi:hypothetical protein
MRPEKGPEGAGRWLLDCLSPDRKEKLCIEQVLWILREARAAGCHAGMAYITQDAGYAPPQPVEPDDEMAALQREFIATAKRQEHLLKRLEAVAERRR